MAKALKQSYDRIDRVIRRRPMSCRELIMSGVAHREIVMGYIKEGRMLGRFEIVYSDEGEPVYSLCD